MYITAQGPRLRNELYCVEWDVKLYYTCIHWGLLEQGSFFYKPEAFLSPTSIVKSTTLSCDFLSCCRMHAAYLAFI